MSTATSRKLRYGLITPFGMEILAEALTVGAEKYPTATDWLTNPRERSEHVDALLRHLYAYLGGQERDADGQHHMGSVMARAMMIAESDKR